ncbi:hypothetical protein PIB30_111276, partial [Stylosanthes scabra]|nr:hypothetical protein [Stylosanthes scabra]
MAPNPTFPLKHLDVIVYMQGANFYSQDKIAAVESFLEESSFLHSFFSCRVPRRPRSPRNTRHHHATDIATPLPPPPPSSPPTPSSRSSMKKTKRQDSSSTDDEEDKAGKKKKPATRKRSRQSDDETSRDEDEIKKPRNTTEKKENENKKNNNSSSSSSASNSGIVIPELPELFKAVILSLHGTEVTFVMKKEVTESDLSSNNNRLSMPERQINSECMFLTDPEIRRIVESRDEKKRVIGLEVGLVEPSGEVCTQVLKRWQMTSAYTYNLAKSSWKDIAHRNHLKKGHLLNI